MVISSRLLSPRIWQKLKTINKLSNETKVFSSFAQSVRSQNEAKTETDKKKEVFRNYRYIYPEFLPDPDPTYRNAMRERLERVDMLARRSVLLIPEFYVGSILAVTYTEPHAPGKVNRFVGICIQRTGCGLRAKFILRNVVDETGVEVAYNLYDPAIQKIECLRLEKRLDNELLFLRDAPLEYSTFPFDMQPQSLLEGTPVPVNDLLVPLNPLPWTQKWERKDLKGITNVILSEGRKRRAKAALTPWEKYDLMKIYRETIPEEDQNEIFSEIKTDLHQLEIEKSMKKQKRMFGRPKKNV